MTTIGTTVTTAAQLLTTLLCPPLIDDLGRAWQFMLARALFQVLFKQIFRDIG